MITQKVAELLLTFTWVFGAATIMSTHELGLPQVTALLNFVTDAIANAVHMPLR